MIAQRGAVDVDGFGRFERTNHKGNEVGRHLHRVGVVNADLARVSRLPVNFTGVGNSEKIVVDDQGDTKYRFEFRFVPAGESAAGVGGLELGGGDGPYDAVPVCEGTPVETPQFVVEDAGEGDGEGPVACRSLATQSQPGPFRVLFVRCGSRQS